MGNIGFVKRIKQKRIWIMQLQKYVYFTGIHINPDGSNGGYVTFNSYIDGKSFTDEYTYIISSKVYNCTLSNSVIIHSDVKYSKIYNSYIKNLRVYHKVLCKQLVHENTIKI